MFLEAHVPKLDERNRLIPPVKFCEELAGGVVLTRDQEHRLYAFTAAGFERIYAQLHKAPPTQKQAHDYVRVMPPGTNSQIPGRQGWITLPTPPRTYTGPRRGLAVAGAGTWVGIWDSGFQNTYLAAQEQVFADTIEETTPGFF